MTVGFPETTLPNTRPHLTGVAALSSDATLESMPDESAKERLVLLGEISAEIAHELFNLLQVIATSAYVAKVDKSVGDEQLDRIERNARCAQAVVQGLLAIARGGSLPAQPVTVRHVLEEARLNIPAEAATFEDHVSESAVLRCDSMLLTRVFHVLFDNAIRASKPHAPKIVVTARTTERHVEISVQDNGPGVPEELASRVFEPLVTGCAGGHGLGLALAKRILLAHGGDLVLERCPAGARFKVVLPTA